MTDSENAALPTLTVSGGAFDGQSLVVALSGSMTIGSAEDANLRIDLENIDLIHAELVFDSRGLLISDVGSSTGTYVNGEKVENDHPLQDGDRVSIGPPGSKQSAKLIVKIPAGATSEAPEPMIVSDNVHQPVVVLPEPDEPVALAVSDAAPKTATTVDSAKAEAPARPQPPPKPDVPPKPKEAEPQAKRSDTGVHRRPDYMSDVPSIATDRPREAPAFPADLRPAPPKVIPKRRASSPLASIPRPVLLGAAGAAVALVVLVALWLLQAPAPVMASLTPQSGEVGAGITILGSEFGSDPGKLAVLFGTAPGKISSAGDTRITVTVPEGAEPGNVQVSVERRGKRSNALFFRIAAIPRIASLNPEVALPGTEVTGTGKNLKGKSTTVLVGGQPAEVLDSQPTSIRFRVPEIPMTPGQKVNVLVKAESDTSPPTALILGRLPLLIDVKPPQGSLGDKVTINGRGFETKAQEDSVTFGGQPAVVLSATESQIVALVPSLGTSSSQTEAPVAVQVQGRASNAGPFLVMRGSTGYFVPRFFPAPVPEHAGKDHVFIATELGPTFILGSAGDSPSVAERALHAAGLLNALMDDATSKPVTLELRDKPDVAVGVAGSPEALLKVLPEDAAAYDEALDPSNKGHRSSQKTVGAFWLALLQDYVACFERHERPFRIVELTPHGKTLLGVYSEALRRAGAGAGVPQGVVNPLTPRLAKSFREMTLSIPSEADASASASIEGTWNGTMDESGSGPRTIAVRLSNSSGKLGGGLTTRSGGLGAEVPLKEISYDRGTSTLRFTLSSGNSPRYFTGTLQGDTITGTIRLNASAKDAIGQFSLKYVE